MTTWDVSRAHLHGEARRTRVFPRDAAGEVVPNHVRRARHSSMMMMNHIEFGVALALSSVAKTVVAVFHQGQDFDADARRRLLQAGRLLVLKKTFHVGLSHGADRQRLILHRAIVLHVAHDEMRRTAGWRTQEAHREGKSEQLT